jgi:DNA-binding LytR/AlgR family response regulator
MKIAVTGGTPEAASALRDVIESWASDNLLEAEISTYRGGTQMLRQVTPGRYDLAFISSVMSDMKGIELVERLWEKTPSTGCVFVSSDESLMPEALNCHAFDYLVRPLGEEQIFQVLDDMRERLPRVAPFFRYTCDRRACHMMFHDLIYARSDGHYIELHSRSEGTHRVHMSMKELQERLRGDEWFFLINKGILVNMGHILSVYGGFCLMDDARRSLLPISVRRGARLKEQLHQYIYQSLCRERSDESPGRTVDF